MPISPPEEEDSDSSPEYDNDDYGDEEYVYANSEVEDSDEDSQEESIHEEAQDEIRENS